MSDNFDPATAGRRLVRVDYRKYDGRPHRNYPALHLGEDEHGAWLGVPGGEFIAATEPGSFKYTDPYVLLVPRHAWWTAMFNAPPRRTEIYCDVATPAVWSDDSVRLIDLDLDVRRLRHNGAVELLDEDEFDTHRKLYGYPEAAQTEAWSAARWLMAALRDGIEPFGTTFHAWLDQVT